jgi:hypothetical protein
VAIATPAWPSRSVEGKNQQGLHDKKGRKGQIIRAFYARIRKILRTFAPNYHIFQKTNKLVKQ